MATDPKYLYSDISDLILQAFYAVRNALPYGLNTDIYKRALCLEMESLGLPVTSDKEISITYKEKIIGSFTLDFVANHAVIIKIINDDKVCEQYQADAKKQLQLTQYEVCLILNFSAEADHQHKRIVLTNDLKRKPLD